MTHETTVWHSAYDRIHQPECGCGWHGEFTRSALSAEVEADGHLQTIKNAAKEDV